MNQQVKVESCAKNVPSQVAARIGLRNRGIYDVQHIAVFAANIDEALVRVDGTSRDGNAFDELVRVHLHERAVLAGGWFRLIRIADHVLGFRRIFGHKGPLHAGGEARAAASAETGPFHLVNDLVGCHLLQRFFECLVSSKLQRDVDLVGVFDAPALADERRFERVPLVKRAGNDRNRLRAPPLVQFLDQAIEAPHGDVFIEIVVDLHRGCTRAGADAFHLFEREDAVWRCFLVPDFQTLLCVLEKLVSPAQHAGHVRANLNVVLAPRLAAQHGVKPQGLLHLNCAKLQAARDLFDQFIRDEAVFVLRVQQHRNQRASLHGVAILQLLKLCR